MSRLTTIIICILISVILGFFLLSPQYQKFSDARWQVKENETERDNQEEYFDYIEGLSKDLESYKEQKSVILSALPSSPDTPDLLNFLASASNKNGLNLQKIVSFSAGPAKKVTGTAAGKEEVPVSGVKEINIEFEVSGNYEALKNFISTLEQSARIIEIESVSLKKKMVEDESSMPSYGLKIKTHYY